ncbi:hypothetical protein H6A68_07535 [Bifidobacterium pullorum subsp. saeculare]|uniref:hypothetical protein n=1 Tax=Bifidobacterium pullorum TaxID=78448 RepID=UPI001959F15A|nr:hypothetical protein [Bifidobacterium pullorum]MBM6706891.1 hypothetical protein [Bifidobacterium pullorum subsp. saeculare]
MPIKQAIVVHLDTTLNETILSDNDQFVASHNQHAEDSSPAITSDIAQSDIPDAPPYAQ